MRRYANAGLCFLEVKVKDQRGMTVKHRLPYDPSGLGALRPKAFAFARTTYSEHYGKPFDYDLHAFLDERYQRITLDAKHGGERMTIDAKLHIGTAGKSLDATGDVLIVETESALGCGFADKCLRRVHARQTKKRSKYCIGMAALGEMTRWNRFMPTMRRLRLVQVTALAMEPKLRLAT